MGKDYPVVVLKFRGHRQSKVPYYLSSDAIARHKELLYIAMLFMSMIVISSLAPETLTAMMVERYIGVGRAFSYQREM